MLILAATPFYLLAVIYAWLSAASVTQARGPVSDRIVWRSLAILFAAMILVRFLDMENVLREALRDFLDQDHMYDNRRELQVAAFFAGLPPILAMLWLLIRSGRSRRSPASRLVKWAGLAGLAYLGLFLARIISLHQVDALLYGGPHANRILDPGLALAVAVLGWRFTAELKAMRNRNPGARSARPSASGSSA